MKLTEEQIWKCNNDGEGGVHICLDHQNVVDFARSIQREIGFAKAEFWIKRINDAVAAEREAILQMSRNQWYKTQADFEAAIRARGNT